MPPRTRQIRTWTPPRFREPPVGVSTGSGGSGPASAGTPVLGSVIIFADPTGTITPGQRVTLTAVRTGTAPVTSYAWAKPPGSSAPSSTTNTLTWIAGPDDSGTYTCTLTAATPDSPASRGITLQVGGVPPSTNIGLVTITGIVVPPEPPAFDPDAAAYIAAVEAADGQALENGVRQAMNAFVVGCKADGIWAALDICNLFMGPRTLAGAIIPLKGSSTPVATNFTEGDYNRRRLKGNSTSKGVDTGYSVTAYPAPNIAPPNHYSWMHLSLPTRIETEVHIGMEADGVFWNQAFTETYLAVRNYSTANIPIPSFPAGFYGIARNNQATVDMATPSVQRGVALATGRLDAGTSTATSPLTIFKNPNPAFSFFAAAELSWYSCGGYLDIALLKGRAEALSAALATAIP